jgi:hypothetical protein
VLITTAVGSSAARGAAPLLTAAPVKASAKSNWIIFFMNFLSFIC